MTALSANIEEFHSRLSTSLLTLEEDSITVFAVRALCRAAWQRWIRANILSDTSSLADGVVEDVTEDAGGDGVFLVLAGTAGEGELVRVWVLFWVEHVGAFRTEAESDLLEVLLWLILLHRLWGRHLDV